MNLYSKEKTKTNSTTTDLGNWLNRKFYKIFSKKGMTIFA